MLPVDSEALVAAGVAATAAGQGVAWAVEMDWAEDNGRGESG